MSSQPTIAYLDNKENLSKTVQRGQTAVVHYDGYLLNGKKFDSSRDRGEPFTFGLGKGQVIRCWDMAVEQIPIGRRAKVTCPSVLAYGKRGVGPIPGDSDLIFDISVIGAQ